MTISEGGGRRGWGVLANSEVTLRGIKQGTCQSTERHRFILPGCSPTSFLHLRNRVVSLKLVFEHSICHKGFDDLRGKKDS